MTLRVAVDEPLIDAVSNEAVIPLGLVTVRVTDPLNPFKRLRPTIDVAWLPVLMESLEGVAVRLKSRKVKTMVATCVRAPLVPVIVRVYVEAD